MRAYAELRRAPLSCHLSNKCGRRLGPLVGLGLDGKPTIFSGYETSTGNSFAAQYPPGLDPFHHGTSPFRVARRRACSALLPALAWTKSALPTLQKGFANMALSRSGSKPLYIQELQRIAHCTGLTEHESARYASIPKGASKCGHSTAGAESSVPGTLNKAGERSRVLTPFREGRSRDFCCVQSGRFPGRFVTTILVLHDLKESPVPHCVVQDFPNKFELTDLRFSIAGRAGVASS